MAKITFCVFCKKGSDFLHKNNYCECKEWLMKQRFSTKYGLLPQEAPVRFMEFARRSFSAYSGNFLQTRIKKRVDQNNFFNN